MHSRSLLDCLQLTELLFQQMSGCLKSHTRITACKHEASWSWRKKISSVGSPCSGTLQTSSLSYTSLLQSKGRDSSALPRLWLMHAGAGQPVFMVLSLALRWVSAQAHANSVSLRGSQQNTESKLWCLFLAPPALCTHGSFQQEQSFRGHVAPTLWTSVFCTSFETFCSSFLAASNLFPSAHLVQESALWVSVNTTYLNCKDEYTFKLKLFSQLFYPKHISQGMKCKK